MNIQTFFDLNNAVVVQEERPIQSEDGGSYPTPPLHCDKNKLIVHRVDNRLANEIQSKNHYLKRKIYIGTNVSYGIEYKDVLGLGIVMFGYPIFHTKEGLVGKNQPFKNGEVVELCRLWLPDEFPKNSESCAIAKSLRCLIKDWPGIKAIITFADTEFFHSGAVYSASGFTYIGWVKGRKAIPGHGQGKWFNAKRKGAGQRPGIRKNVYIKILNGNVDLDYLRQQYKQDEMGSYRNK